MRVVEIFKSIEGEGIRAGLPAVFIRLAGCNLRCAYCDTKYSYDTANSVEMSIPQICDAVKKFNCNRVTLTGGEPLIHNDVDRLIWELTHQDFEVNIETNGDAAGFVIGGNDNGGTIRNSYNLGDINGALAGGLFCKGKVIIENCYNKGNVLGKEVAGGLAGQLLSGSGIKNAYNIGNVDASTDYYGAIVGQAHNSVKVENTHYLNTSLGKADKYAKEKTADFMRSQDFVNILNDNTDVWAKDEDEANDGYPILLPTKHLDVEEYFDTDNAVSIFPNPATDYINITGEFVSCAIYDVVGNMVYSDENISDEAVNISVADYASGVYFVRCLARNGGVVTKKLVVK